MMVVQCNYRHFLVVPHLTMVQDYFWIEFHLKQAKRKSAIPQNTIVEVNLKTGTASLNNLVPWYNCEKNNFYTGYCFFWEPWFPHHATPSAKPIFKWMYKNIKQGIKMRIQLTSFATCLCIILQLRSVYIESIESILNAKYRRLLF